MAGIRRDWLTNQNTDCCFVVIGLVGRQSHGPLLQLKIDPVPKSLLAPSIRQRIFISIRGQYGIQKNIYIYPWFQHTDLGRHTCPAAGLLAEDPAHEHRRWTASSEGM